MNTPWGKSDSVIKITKGVSWVNTPGHGGLAVSARVAIDLGMLSDAAQAQAEFKVTKKDSQGNATYGIFFFEEDSAYAIAFYEHPEWMITLNCLEGKLNHPVTPDGIQYSLLPVLSLYHADYLIARGVAPLPTEYATYLEHKELDRLRAEKSPNLIVAAEGDWSSWVPTGKVGVHTADGAQYLLPAEDYPVKGYLLTAYPHFTEVR